jgi:oligosaccharide repeat unit polymerase
MLGRTTRQIRVNWAASIFVNSLLLTLLVLLAFVYFNSTLSLHPASMITILTVYLLVVFVWGLWSWRVLTGSLFDPYALFLIAAVLFNGGQAFLELFHLNDEVIDTGIEGTFSPGILGGRFSPETIVETLFLVALGLVAFHTGGLLSVPSYRRNLLGQKAREKSVIPTLRALRLIGWGLLGISLVPAFFYLKDALTIASTLGWYEYQRQEILLGIAGIPRNLTPFIIPATVFLLAGSKNHRFNIALSGVIVLSYSITLFLIGARAGAVMPLIGYAWVYHRCIRPLPKAALLAAGGLMLFVIFPLVKAFRGGTGGGRFALNTVFNEFFSVSNPIVSILYEMGSSMRTVAYTIDLVPHYRDFGMGESYLFALAGLVPRHLFWEAHPIFTYGSVSRWLLVTVNPELSNPGFFTWGFSFIGEAYFNFGWLGAPFALAIMGFLLGKFVLWAKKSSDPAKIALVGAFTGFFLIFARGESNEIIRYLVWYSLFPYLAVHGVRLLMRPKFYKTNGRFRRSGGYLDGAARPEVNL